jgi:lipid-binding SYLF domain-containing protein
MFFSIHLPIFISTGIISMVFLLFPPPTPLTAAKSDSFSQDALDVKELVTKSDIVFQSFQENPNMIWFHDNVGSARGIFIVPQMLRGSFLIGGTGGSGVLLARDPATGKWSCSGFHTLDSVSMGLQIGADASEIILMIITEKGMNAMLSPEFKIGADVTVAAASVDQDTSQPSADILAFARSMMGIFSGISLDGAVIAPRTAWNNAYYGKTFSPEDILMRHSISNACVDPSRRIIPAVKRLPRETLEKK